MRVGLGDGTVHLTRQELYDQVWSQPMSTLAHYYGLSDVALAKTCVKHRIPRPPRGYWQRIKSGKKVRRPALPVPRASDPERITIIPRQAESRPPSTLMQGQAGFEAAAENRITVAASTADLHPLVRKTGDALRRSKPDARGLLTAPKRASLDIRVTPEILDRALRIMDAVVRACEARGHKLAARSGEHRLTTVTVNGEPIAILLEEKVRQVDHVLTAEEKIKKAAGRWISLPRYDFHPTGTLILRLLDSGYSPGIRQMWSDGKRQRVEDRLNDFMVGLAGAAEAIKAERERRADLERRREEDARRRWEQEQLRWAEEQRIRKLEQETEKWAYTRRIRDYLNELELTAIREHGMVHPDSEFGEWLRWARAYVDRIDPARERLAGNVVGAESLVP